MKPEVCAIFAVGPYNVIGIEDKLPWHSKQDFYHFKKTTKGYPCLFGDRTFFGLPKYPLPDRLNVVVSFDCNETEVLTGYIEKDGIETAIGSYINVPTIELGLDTCSNYSKIFVCGGRSIYKYCLENNLIDIIYLTEIEDVELAKDIEKDKTKYVEFPIDLKEYLKENWNKEEITYSDLPEEDSDIKVKFYKYTKIK